MWKHIMRYLFIIKNGRTLSILKLFFCSDRLLQGCLPTLEDSR